MGMSLGQFLLISLLVSDAIATSLYSSGRRTTTALTTNFCTKKESLTISKYFYSIKYDNSFCPARKYFLDLRNNDPSNHKIFIDIGANKGYNFALMYSLWLPHLRIDGRKWFEMAIKDPSIKREAVYGNCNDYKEKLYDLEASEIPKQNSSNLKMLAVDLSTASLQLVRDISSRLTQEFNTQLIIPTLHTAISNFHGTTKSGKCIHSFDERCRISSLGRITIPVTTIDHLWPQLPSLLNLTEEGKLKERRVDILMIDTEGSDALVLEGGSKTLANRLVRLLIFEYHGYCPWPLTTLHEVVKTLHSYGYVCYFEGQNRLWRLSGCWSSLYEFYAWANVICVDHQDPWAAILERYRVKTEDALEYFNSTSGETEYIPPKKKNCTKQDW
jgi:hypothetical protein